ncbi:MAG: hypothetical protein K5752_07240 [Succinivibrionaceae bacterium]|nr:hypothetical protein [Succinivibrionaceae bacterium]
MSNVISFNYSSPSEATYDNKLSVSWLTGDVNLCWAESNTLAITNDYSLGILNVSCKICGELKVAYDMEFKYFDASGAKNLLAHLPTHILGNKLKKKLEDNHAPLQSPEIPDLKVTAETAVSTTYNYDIVQNNALFYTCGRDLTIENTIKKFSVSAAGIVGGVLAGINLIASEVFVVMAAGVVINQQSTLSDLNEIKQGNEQTSSSSSSKTLTVTLPDSMSFFVSSSGRKSAYIIKKGSDNSNHLSVSDAKLDIYKITKGTNPVANSSNDTFTYEDDVTYGVFSFKITIAISDGGNKYEGTATISKNLPVTQNGNSYSLKDLSYTFFNESITMKNKTISSDSFSGKFPFLVKGNDNGIELHQLAEPFIDDISSITSTSASEGNFSNLKIDGTDNHSYKLKLSTDKSATLVPDSDTSAKLNLLDLKTFKYNKADYWWLGNSGGKPAIIKFNVNSDTLPSVDTNKKKDHYLNLYDKDETALNSTQSDECTMKLKYGVSRSSKSGMKYQIEEDLKISIDYNEDTKKYTMTAYLDIGDKDDDKNFYSTKNTSRSVVVKNGSMIVSRSINYEKPGITFKSDTMSDFQNAMFMIYANNANRDLGLKEFSEVREITYKYFFFRIVYDNSTRKLIVIEPVITDYNSFYNTFAEAGNEKNNPSGKENQVPIAAGMAVAAAAPLALAAGIGLAELIKWGANSEGINYTAKSESVLFHVLNKDKALTIAPAAGIANDMIQLKNQNGSSSVEMISSAIELCIKQNNKTAVHISGNGINLKCGNSLVEATSDSIKLEVGKSSAVLTSDKLSINVNGKKDVIMITDTKAVFNVSGNKITFK